MVLFLLLLFWSATDVSALCFTEGELEIDEMNSVLICANGQFINLCGQGFSENEASAACRDKALVTGRLLSPGNVTNGTDIYNFSFNCLGHETSLSNCVSSMEMCDSRTVARVDCSSNYLPILPLNYPGAIQETFSINIIDELFTEFNLSNNLTIGGRSYGNGYIYSHGLISFGDEILDPLTVNIAASNIPSILSPFLVTTPIPSNTAVEGRIQYRSLHPESPNLEIVSHFVEDKISPQSFSAELLLLVDWRFGEQSFSFQTIVVTDFNNTYTIFTYVCDPDVEVPAKIGVNIQDGFQEVFRYSSTPYTSLLACINNVRYYNLFYNLSATEQQIDGTSGSCLAAGLTDSTCCMEFGDPTSTCGVPNQGKLCYCDALCFERNDCCNDIDDVNDLRPCVQLCEEGVINQAGNVIYPVGPIGICENGFFRFIEDSDISDTRISTIACQTFQNQTDSYSSDELQIREFTMTQFPISRSNVICTGLENDIEECQSEIDIDVEEGDDVVVMNCINQTFECINSEIQLSSDDSLNLVSNAQGIVEICIDGRWRRVCATGSPIEIELLCNLLGFQNTTDAYLTSVNSADNMIGITMLQCSSQDESLSDCSVMLNSCEQNPVKFLSCDGSPLVSSSPSPSKSPSSSSSSSPSPSPSPSQSPFPINPGQEQVTVPVDAIAASASVGVFVIIIVIIIACVLVVYYRRKGQKQKPFALTGTPDELSLEDYTGVKNRYVSEFTFNNAAGSRATVKETIMKDLSNDLVISNNMLRLLDCVGHGEFGLVYKAHLLTNNAMPQYVAVKTLKGSFQQDEIDALLKESVYMKQLNHPNVMELVGVCLDAGTSPYIILPYMAGGSLLSYLKKNRSELLIPGEYDDDYQQLEIKLLSMCLQIAKGMEYIAGLNLIHRDLAARNCMIDHNGNIKIADFGLSKGLYEKMYFRQEKTEGVKLPIKWMALESVDDGIFSEKSDVWSFGVTCWEIFSGGKVPFGGIIPHSLPKILQQGERMERPNNAACSQKTYEKLMLDCWHSSPEDRPTFSELVELIDKTLTSMAGYLDFNQFNLVVTEELNKETVENTDEESNE